MSVVTKNRAYDWVFVYGNLEQHDSSCGVFVCKWVHHLVRQYDQFQFPVGKYDMECFQYESASTVIKCCNFVKQNVFVQLPKQWNWNFMSIFSMCLYYVLCVFLLFRHTLFYMCFSRSAIQVRQRRRTGFLFSLELDEDETVGSLRTSSMRAFLVPPSGFTFGW